jgi:hypothetical protein
MPIGQALEILPVEIGRQPFQAIYLERAIDRTSGIDQRRCPVMCDPEAVIDRGS